MSYIATIRFPLLFVLFCLYNLLCFLRSTNPIIVSWKFTYQYFPIVLYFWVDLEKCWSGHMVMLCVTIKAYESDGIVYSTMFNKVLPSSFTVPLLEEPACAMRRSPCLRRRRKKKRYILGWQRTMTRMKTFQIW